MLGPAVWRLSREYDWSRMLISSCREPVRALATRTGETAHLAVREGREVFFIDHHASGDQGVIVSGQTGKLMPLHCTAHGKSLLADFGLAELRALYGSTPLERYTRANQRVAAGPGQGLRPGPGRRLFHRRRGVPGGRPLRGRAGPRSGRPGDRLDRRVRSATRMSNGRDAVLAQHVRDTAEHINALLGA